MFSLIYLAIGIGTAVLIMLAMWNDYTVDRWFIVMLALIQIPVWPLAWLFAFVWLLR